MIMRLNAWWTDRSLRTKMLVAIAVPVLAISAAVVALAYSGAQESSAADEVARTIEVQALVGDMLADLYGVETSVRGYLISGLPEWLGAYHTDILAIPKVQDVLRRLVKDPAQVARVEALRPLIARRLELFRQLRAVAPRSASNGDAILGIMSQGNALTNDLRARLDTISTEQRLLTDRNRATFQNLRAQTQLIAAGTIVVAVGGGIIALLLLSSGVVARLRRIEANARRLAAGEPLENLPAGRDEIGRVAETLLEAQELLGARTADLHSALADLRSALAEVEDLYANAPVGYHSLDPDGRFIRVNDTELEWLGLDRASIIGHQFTELLTEQGRKTFAREFNALLVGDSVRDIRYDLVRADGSLLPVRVHPSAVRDAHGAFQFSRTIVEDITDRQQAERWAGELFDSFAAPVAIFDPVRDESGAVVDFRRVYANPRTAAILGRPMSEVIGTLWRKTTLAAHRDAAFATFVRVLKTGAPELMPDLEAVDPATGHTIVLSLNVIRLDELVAQVSRDVTFERTAEREITAARVTAEAADRSKTEFLSRMSHELRTPLNAVIGFGQLLELDDLGPEQRDSVGQILSAGRHLLNLINEVLEISRIESGQLTLSVEAISLREAMRDVTDLIAPLAKEHFVRLETAGVAQAGYVLADRQRLRQVLLNLLSNAVKYNRSGGDVTLTSETVAGPDGSDHLKVMVSDDGPGIDPAMLDRVFAPFDRLGAERGGVEGTGLGMALSKSLVEAMGGRIGVESERGKGSTFWFSLPLTSPMMIAERMPDESITLDAAAESVVGVTTVLYIEDNPSNLRLVERALERRTGFRLIAAMLGGLGIDLAREHNPDLVLLDLHLPDISGEEVLARLRAEPATADTPIVILSAEATMKVRDRLLAMGATQYLAKPIELKELYRVIDSLARRAGGAAPS